LQGVSGSSSKSSSSSAYGANQLFTVEQSGQSSTNNNFTLRAKALVVREGFERPTQDQSPRQIDPAMLARIALEEELKRKSGGGGGGGSAPSFNPNMWVSYSYKLMNKAMEQLYELFNKILDQSTQASSSAMSNMAAQAGAGIANVFSRLTSPFQNLFSTILRSNSNPATAPKTPLEAALKLSSDFVQLANILFSSLINGLKKSIYGKDDDTKDLNNQKQEDDTFSLMGLDAIVDEDNEANGKSIKSHMDNIARQYNNWANSFKD
jgi:hypothetical protein